MGYSGYSNPTPPRSIRVILGAKLAIACFFFGTMMLTHKYHRALTMQAEPDEVTWQELADNGLDGNSFIRLTDVELSGLDTVDMFEEFFEEIDPDADPDELEAKFAESMEAVNTVDVLHAAMTPVKVVPIGTEDADSIRELLVIPRIEGWTDEAMMQLDDYGTLSGYVSTYDGGEFARTMMKLTGIEDPEFEEAMDERLLVYTLEPRSEALDQSAAATNFALVGLGLSLGLVICGSGGPSLICCIFFWFPSVLSLIGYPMRYGRGGTMTRLLYMVIGAALMGYGYKLAVIEGRFGEVGGDPVFHALGFISTFVGVAAAMSVPMQILVRRFIASTEVQPTKKNMPKMSMKEACSLEPLDTEGPEIYRDLKTAPSSGWDLPDEVASVVESLSPLGFGEPLDDQWQHGNSSAFTAIQLGCQDMVVADVEHIEGEIRTQLVSVLHDGLVVLTVSQNSNVARDTCLGTNGYYCASQSNHPVEMIAMHLEETVNLAEKRGTTVVKIDEGETLDVCKLGRRALADTRAQWGEIELEVGSKSYGRFKFPAQRIIGELASV